MAYESITATQACRSYLKIAGQTRTVVKGYVNGDEYSITIKADPNYFEFDFGEEKICGYESFTTLYQDMEWDTEQGILLVSNKKPKYSFNIFFPRPN
ncbi:hypothetical protein NO486_004027 [Salmonella enterica]|nr:hypothetical protein [Salmonella enterica]